MDEVLSRVLRLWCFVLVFSFVFMAIVVFSKNLWSGNLRFDDFKTNREIAVEEHWDVYYNGQKVDIENIDLGLYNCSYDRNKKKVFIADKTSSSSGSEGLGILWFFLGRSLR